MAESHDASPNVAVLERPGFPSDEASAIVRQLAHDLRQSLSVIESIVYYLGIVLPRDERRTGQQLNKIRDQIQQIDWTIGDALHLMQASPVRLELADLNHLVSRSLSEWAETEGVRSHTKLAGGLPCVEMDPGQIRHLLHTLLECFQQAGGSTEDPTVTTAVRGDSVCLTVHGTAGPAATDDWQRFFDQAGAGLPRDSGMGLACARRICEANRARLEAEARPASGLTLAVVFPLPPASS